MGKYGRFVGMLPSEQLQQYLMRAVTGLGDRVQAEVTDRDLRETSGRVSSLAGEP